jgi:hypothetical protein
MSISRLGINPCKLYCRETELSHVLVEIDIPQCILSLLMHSELILSNITFWVCAENVCLKVDTCDWTVTFCRYM